METCTLRWSADRSLYFVEPSRGRNARGFWLGAEKKEFPVPPEIIKGPGGGAFAFDGYWRQWVSMRYPVRQSDPQSGVSANAELVRDYLVEAHLVTRKEAIQIAETNRIEAAAREHDKELAAHQNYLLEQHEAAAKEAAETAARDAAEKSAARRAQMPAHQEYLRGQHQARVSATSEPNPDTAPPVATGRPNKRDRRRGN